MELTNKSRVHTFEGALWAPCPLVPVRRWPGNSAALREGRGRPVRAPVPVGSVSTSGAEGGPRVSAPVWIWTEVGSVFNSESAAVCVAQSVKSEHWLYQEVEFGYFLNVPL